MLATNVLRTGLMAIFDYRCSAWPSDSRFLELHHDHSVSYVRQGSFGYRCGGWAFELVAGSISVGHLGAEYVRARPCAGRRCLSFLFAPALVQALSERTRIWEAGAVPPLAELMVVGELAQLAAESRSTSASTRPGLCCGASSRDPDRPRDCAVRGDGASADAPWRRRCRSMATPTSPLTSRARRTRQGSTRSTFCGSSSGCSASRRTNTWSGVGCAAQHASWPRTPRRPPTSS